MRPSRRAPTRGTPRLVRVRPTSPRNAAALERSARLEEASAELDAQIGMGALKDQIKTFRARVRMAEQRRKLGLKTPSASNHMVFVGPPGTGKTSVARVIAKILCGLGIVKTSNVVEVSAKDLIGKYLGDSEDKTREIVKRAYDGVLFIDEAYALISKANNASNTDDFGKAVVDTLLTFIENDRDRLVVIIAGYEADIDRLLASNEGMKSRFAHRFRFATYTPDELVAITKLLAEGRDDVLDAEAVALLLRTCQRLSGMWIDSRNGVLVPKGWAPRTATAIYGMPLMRWPTGDLCARSWKTRPTTGIFATTKPHRKYSMRRR